MKNSKFREWLEENIQVNQQLFDKYEKKANEAWNSGDDKNALFLDSMKYHFEDDERTFKQVLYMYDLMNEDS